MSRSRDASGNALEYAIVSQIANDKGVPIKASKESKKAYDDFMLQPKNEQKQLLDAAKKSVNHILNVEKSLVLSKNSEVEMQPDIKGRSGDPRDILLTLAKGALGISCKRNNKTMKNPRLQRYNLNFWKMWRMSGNVSQKYCDAIGAVFDYTDKEKDNGAQRWYEINDLHRKVYEPVILAVAKEFQEAILINDKICEQFVSYMVGVPDYYKVMAYLGKRVVVQGFNFSGTLSCHRLSYPKKLLSIEPFSQTTIILFFDGGWVFGMRIHTADTKLGNSLKWDIKLIGHPDGLYSHCISL